MQLCFLKAEKTSLLYFLMTSKIRDINSSSDKRPHTSTDTLNPDVSPFQMLVFRSHYPIYLCTLFRRRTLWFVP